mgnify:CR=1 FL=1
MNNQRMSEDERKLLHGQMCLLAEKSKNCSADELADMTRSMLDICAFLYGGHREPRVAGFRQQENES